MKKRGRSVAAVGAICALGLSSPVALAAAAVASPAATTVRIHCGRFKFATGIKITGPTNEAHSGWNCDTATDMLEKGTLSHDRKEFSSPGWNCSRAPTTYRPYTFYCSKHRVLVEFDA